MHERGNQYFGLITSTTEKIPVWRIGRLWELAASLPVQMIPLTDLASSLDASPPQVWNGLTPTMREVAELARHINQVDLAYPIILSAEGHVLDGHHRIAKAWISGYETIAAVQFSINPEPDQWLDREGLPLPAEGKVNVYVPGPLPAVP